MRLTFDILGATEKSGGMRLHATEIIRTWSEIFPEDELVVVGGEWSADEFAAPNIKVHVRQHEKALSRAVGQLFITPRVARRERADAVLSLSPIVSPLVPKSGAFCFQHDWRHKKNPHEFPLAQRLYRKLWEVSANHARLNVCISEKAARETRQHAQRSQVRVIENGRDHARRWELSEASPFPTIVTFGHHNNKRPELVIGAMPEIVSVAPDARLVVLGARGAYGEELSALAEAIGVGGNVQLPGFVEDAEYQRIMSSAATVVLASSDEGFGLPVAEAQYFGIPVVITSDSGMDEIFGDYPIVAAPSAETIGVAVRGALTSRREQTPPTLWSWADTVRTLREEVASAARGV